MKFVGKFFITAAICIVYLTRESEADFSFKKTIGRIGSIFGIQSKSNDDDSEEIDSTIEVASRLGSMIIAPVSNFMSERQDTTTPYNYANYAFSPGYYKGSVATCSQNVKNAETINAVCIRDNVEISCNENLYAGDIIRINCKIGYEYPAYSVATTEIECTSNGKWSSPIYECQAVCGKMTKKSSALIVHGEETEVTEFPWNVAIYKKDILICGGNIISERVILSAAHCFVAESQTGIDDVPIESFTVIAGKYFRSSEAIEKHQTQQLTIKSIKKHDAYYGFAGNYDADIAVVTLNERIVFQHHVAPVCLNLDLKTIVEKQIPTAGTMGMVAGYGYIEYNDQPSDRLKKIELPIVDTKQCKREAPDSFKPFVTSDKFCAGYTDGTGAVCKGDSGGGFVVPKSMRDDTVYYIHGIVSNTRSFEGGCDKNFYTLFTHVQNYIDIIKEEVRISKI